MSSLGSGAVSRVFNGRYGIHPTAFKIFRDEAARREEQELVIVIQGSNWQLPSSCWNLLHCFGPDQLNPSNPRKHAAPFPLVVYGLHYELAPHGSLAQFLRVERPLRNEALCYVWAHDLFCALRFLHGKHIHHNDVKPENILVFANGVLKLGDFNLSRHTPDDKALQSRDVLGTPS